MTNSLDAGARLSGPKSQALACGKTTQCVCARDVRVAGGGGGRDGGQERPRASSLKLPYRSMRYTVVFYFCIF